MSNRIQVTKNDRLLEIRAIVAGGDYQIWILENGEKVYLYEVVPYHGSSHDWSAVQSTLRRARADIENESIIIPVVRNWPIDAHRPGSEPLKPGSPA
jgi:hypothetical protein